MNQNLLEALKNHLSHQSYLSSSQVEEILLLAPEALYTGPLYRVLESDSLEKQDLTGDSSFSRSQNGIKYFLNTHNFKNIHIYKASGSGLDLVALSSKLKKMKIKFPEYVFNEEEVIVLKIDSYDLIYSGPASSFK